MIDIRFVQFAGILALLVCVSLLSGCSEPTPDSAGATVPSSQLVALQPEMRERQYVGSSECKQCHQEQFEQWQGSHHQLAMATPGANTVAGDFDNVELQHDNMTSSFAIADGNYVIKSDGAKGQLEEFSVVYTFGVAPLQQYLVATENGRLQASSLAWDSRPDEEGGQRWFHLLQGQGVDHNDVLHWTGPAGNWNAMCADCHSTGIQKNYDEETRTYDTDYAEISVGCEACHGQGAAHVEWASSGAGTPAILPLTDQPSLLNSCAACHSRRAQIAEGFSPDKPFLDHYVPSLLDADLYHADGQILDEVFVYGSFLQSRMFAAGVSCSDCHAPHSGKLKQLGNALCTTCHNSVGRADFPTVPKADFDSPAHHFHLENSPGAACVNCHMPSRTYMAIDDRRDHRFGIPRPDLSQTLGVPNACNQCHEDQSAQWASQVVEGWYGASRAAHFAATFDAARSADPEVERALTDIAQSSEQAAIVRGTALSLLQNYTLNYSSQAIEQGLLDADPLVRIGALRGARRWSVQRRWQKIRPLLDDALLAVRTEVVHALLRDVGELSQTDRLTLQPYLQAYLRVASLNADTAPGQSGLAEVYLALGDLPRAEAALQTSLTLNPQWVPAMINLADLWRATGRDQLGGAILAEALQTSPETPEVLLARSLWLVRQGQANTALPLLSKAASLAPLQVRYAYVYSIALHSNGMSEQALDVIDEFLRQRDDQQLLQAGYSIARDAGLAEKQQEYAQRLNIR